MADDPTKSIWSRNGGLYVGSNCKASNGGRPDLIERPAEIITDRQVIVFGPNGSGKTRRFVYPNMLKLTECSIVVLDLKGEIFFNTAQHRSDTGSEVIAHNPFGVRDIPSTGYNPVLSLDANSNSFVDDCDGIAHMLSPAEGSNESRHFDEAAQDLISIPLLNTKFDDTPDDQRSLAYVRYFVNLPPKEMAALMREIGARAERAGFHALAGRTMRFQSIKETDRELGSIISTARNKLRWLDSPPIADDLSQGGFNWEEMKERPITTYLILPANRIYQHRQWLKLILHCILARLLNDPTPSKVPVLFILDEAALIAGIPLIEESMAILRGFGIKIVSLYQDFPQAELALGKRVQSYIANAGILIGYAPQDLDTAQLLAQRGGVRQDNTTSVTLNRDAQTGRTATSFGVSSREREAILPQDLMNMPPGYAVLYSHQHAGARTVFFPDPTDVPELQLAMLPPKGASS